MTIAATRRIQVGRDLTEDDPCWGFRSDAEFFGKVMDAGNGRRVDSRLEPLRVAAAAGSDEQSGNEGQYGAFLIPLGFSSDVLSVSVDDPTAGLVRPVTMDQPTVNLPARTDKDHTTSVSGGLIVTRKRQTVIGTSSRMGVESVTLTANTVFGLTYGTEEVVRSTPRAFLAILGDAFRDEMAAHGLVERLFGVGSGEPLGVMNSPCLITVAKETGQVPATIVTENIDKMVGSCWRYSSRGAWLANDDCLPQLQALTRSVGDGGAPSEYLTYTDDGQTLLLGKPIYFTEFCTALGTSGDIVLGVWDQYLAGMYQPLASLESIFVRFDTNEHAFKFWMRTDGAPWWKAPLLPRHSQTKRSPFVALATR